MSFVRDYTRGREAPWVLPTIHSEAETMGVEPAFDVFGLEYDPLSLPEGPKQTSFEGSLPKVDLAAIVVSNNDPRPGTRVVSLDYALHGGAL